MVLRIESSHIESTTTNWSPIVQCTRWIYFHRWLFFLFFLFLLVRLSTFRSFFLLQYNIWITIGNIGVCVQLQSGASAVAKITAVVCIQQAKLCVMRARCNVQYYISHRYHRCEAIVCWANKYLWANGNGRFMLNNKSSGFKGNGYRKQNVFTYCGDDVGRRQWCQTSALRKIV